MGLPLAYFLTWTTYGTWLPGDRRGWVDKHAAGPQAPYQEADPLKETLARKRMKEPPVLLSAQARLAVEKAIAETCAWRGWLVRAVEVRSNHVHVVVSAGDISPGMAMKALKSHGSRALNGLLGRRKRWWGRHGSTRYLNDEQSLAAAVQYVNSQDTSWLKEE